MFNITVGLIGASSTKTGTLASREIAIGRDPTNDLVLDNGSVSRTHCRLVAIEGAAIVLDEGSKNGTWLNGKPVAHPAVLKFEDELVIGPYLLRVQSLVGRGTAAEQELGVRPHPLPSEESDDSQENTVLSRSLSTLEERRQALRWLMREPVSNPRFNEVLRAALKDSDIEVRMTAVLAAAKLRARDVLPALQSSDLPTLLQEVDDPRERRFHEALWHGVIRYLQERRHPGDSVPGRDPLQPLWRLLAGDLAVTDPASLLLHSLTTPLEAGRRPQQLPPGVVQQNGRFYLERSGLPLRWIAPVKHWLGANPVRQVMSPGFFVAQVPVDRPVAKWVGNPLPIRVAPDHEQVWLGSFKEAEQLCAELSRIENAHIRLPSADEWEMAARGTDGRRYPWGNLPQEDWEECASPWGVEYLVGDVPEWTFEPETETQLLRGGVEARTWVRHPVYPGEEEFAAALRPIIPGV
ncbi:FHA domain-containing protein [Archangium sp.]|uniref:FHA domain-containing protein n=1 Tax=Archangium sp. TaxID=1872627 RepID=UPI002D607E0A|nr:FHA domain-containing protein [Archangium sp.]HYO52292.1 FHA domain-containing protein [Archangium sp.]